MENTGSKTRDALLLAIMLLGIGLMSYEVYIGDLEIGHAMTCAFCGAIFYYLAESMQRQ